MCDVTMGLRVHRKDGELAPGQVVLFYQEFVRQKNAYRCVRPARLIETHMDEAVDSLCVCQHKSSNHARHVFIKMKDCKLCSPC